MAELVYRSYMAEFEANEHKRIIEGRAVPYGVSELVADADSPGAPYNEMWVHRAFEQQVNTPRTIGRVKFTYNHEDGLDSWIGKTLDLTERADGLYGRWRVDETKAGDTVLYKVLDEQLTGLSIGAIPLENVTLGSMVKRVRARLDHVSLVSEPAFEDAKVLAVRSKPPVHRQSAAERLAKLREQRERYS